MNEENVCPKKPGKTQHQEIKDRMKNIMEPHQHVLSVVTGRELAPPSRIGPQEWQDGEAPITLNLGEKTKWKKYARIFIVRARIPKIQYSFMHGIMGS